MSDSGASQGPLPGTQTREFWRLLAYAAVLGVVGAFVGLVFLGVVKVGSRWFDVTNVGWFGGQWWWVAVTAAAGLVVGVLHLVMGLPDRTEGVIQGLQTGHVETSEVPGVLVTSAVSLMAGASLGPEKALGTTVGGAGAWVSRRRGLTDDQVETNTYSGFAAAYGGLLSSPVIVVMLILELARPGGERFTRLLVNTTVASSVSFGVYFAIAGSIFLGIYDVPQYTFAAWQLLAAAGLGVVSAVITMGIVLVMAVTAKTFGRAKIPRVVKPVIGGIAFGVIGVALPLTMFTGSDQLATVLKDAPELGVGLVLAMLVGKTLAFAVSSASGFVGGPVFPAIFLGGTAGVATNLLVPGLPLGLTFTCMLASVLGSLVSAPFSMVLLAALMTQVGALQTAPILVSVMAAFLTMSGSQFLVKLKARAATPPAPATPA